MKLSSNPFFVLRLPCSSGRREIVSATEELSFILDPDVCSSAQNDLINLGKRLTAEIGWFPELDKDAVIQIQERIDSNEELATDDLTQLSRLNATLYNFSISDEDDPYEIGYAILDIDEQYSALDVTEITAIINNNREVAKIASVQEKDVADELNKKRDDIRQIITERLSSFDQESYVELITMLAEKCIADDDYEDGVVLADVVDQYEVRMQSQLEESTEGITTHIDRIQHLANDEAISDNIKSLIRRVQKWDKLAQPLQLKSQASGMPHEISENLGRQLRNLALFLHNEKGKTEEALTLVEAMKDVFAELDGLADLFDSDSDALNDLIQGEEEAKAILAEMDAVQKQAESLKTYATTSSVNSFIERVKKLDVRLKSIDLDPETRTKVRENLCYMARATAIELHNTKQKTSEALTIARALATEFSDMPSLRLKLNEDVTTLNQQWLLSMSRNVPSRSYSAPSKSSSSNPGCLIGIVIFIVIAIIIAATSGGGSSSSKSSTNTSKPSSSYSQSANSGSTTSSYTVTLNKSSGSGGTSSVTVKNGSSMPYATAPSRSGYVFKGYYSSSNGSGTKYYDANMNSVHNWDKSSGGTLYAYWEKQQESKFTTSAASGDPVYIDIVSIFPEIGIYTQGSSNYSEFVCRCKTSAGTTVWVYMTCSEYKSNFDSSASTSIFNSYADEKTFSSKRIHGTAKKAENIMSGLSSDTGTMVIDFSSVN